MVRETLALTVSAWSDAQLQAVWKALDADDSGYIDLGEFGRFMKKGASFRIKLAVGKGTEDESKRRRRLAKQEKAERALEAKRNADQQHRVAARKAADLARQMEMEAERLEAAMRRKAFRGVGMRASMPSVGLSKFGCDGGVASALGTPQRSVAPVRPSPGLLPPLRVGHNVDF